MTLDELLASLQRQQAAAPEPMPMQALRSAIAEVAHEAAKELGHRRLRLEWHQAGKDFTIHLQPRDRRQPAVTVTVKTQEQTSCRETARQ